MNNINDLITIINVNLPQVDIAYMDFEYNFEPDTNKVTVLTRNKKIGIFNGDDVSDIQESIDKELNPNIETDSSVSTLSPKLYTKSIHLSTIKITESDIVSKIKNLADSRRNSEIKVVSVFDIDTTSMDPDNYKRRIYSKITGASNYIATTARVGPASFIITNENISNNLDLDMFKMSGMNIFIDNSIVDEIVIGRKTDKNSSGIVWLINESTGSESIAELGWNPGKNYLTIKYK